ncbi:MAG: site-2 protease family protein [Actinomycetota bacterium]|nr:site-2 protease family protein [Actinomycetota bacterium]
MMSGPLGLLQGGLPGLIAFVLLAGALVVAIGLHEYAHALAADLQGDRLPRAMGRLTINPLRHLDPLGTVLIFIAGFGWGKPVEFRPEALSSRRFGAAIVALAGPMMNILLAILGGFLYRLSLLGPELQFLDLFLQQFIFINAVLAVFNLIPVPPLDGSRLLTIFLPPSKQKIIYFLDRYGFLILLVVVFLGPRTLFDPIIDFVIRVVGTLTGLTYLPS